MTQPPFSHSAAPAGSDMTPGHGRAPETKAHNGWVGLRPRRPASPAQAQTSAIADVAAELQSARAEGRVVLRLPLSAIQAGHLVRDRMVADREDMAALIDSLRARGQQTPIEVVDLGADRYGLISGWRRIRALHVLAAEDAQRFGFVQALVRAPGGAADAYRAMVEENEVRADLSFYERARIAVEAARQSVYADTKSAVQSLFSAARPAKRSKILAFAALVETLEGHLRFPTAIPEKLGLSLAALLQRDPAAPRRIAEALRKAAPKDADDERKVLNRVLTGARSAARPASDAVAPGIALQAGKQRLVLTGTAVNDALVRDLRAWLTARRR